MFIKKKEASTLKNLCFLKNTKIIKKKLKVSKQTKKHIFLKIQITKNQSKSELNSHENHCSFPHC